MRRGAGLAAVIGLLAVGLAAAPSAHARESCSSLPKAKNVQAYGVTCSQANKVIAKDLGIAKCRHKCSFTKVGYLWKCEQRPSGKNACNSEVNTKRYTVTFNYAGHGRRARAER